MWIQRISARTDTVNTLPSFGLVSGAGAAVCDGDADGAGAAVALDDDDGAGVGFCCDPELPPSFVQAQTSAAMASSIAKRSPFRKNVATASLEVRL